MRRSRSYRPRYSRRLKTIKYSNETINASGNFAIGGPTQQQIAIPLITSVSIQGTRKCKNFELSLCGSPWSPSSSADVPVSWVLVYVPEGTDPGKINEGDIDTPASTYEPSQNVIMSGLWPSNLTSNYKVKTRLARNLNSGDSVYLVLRPSIALDAGANKTVVASLNYAIAY